MPLIPGLNRKRAVPVTEPPAIGVLHTLTIYNDAASPSSGLVKFGLAFEKDDIPSGYIPRVQVGDNTIRSAVIDKATWSNGSLRKATIAIDLGTVAGSSSASLEISAVAATQPTNTFNVASFISGLADDSTVDVTNRIGSSTGAKSNLEFSLKTAFAVSTRREVTDNTNLIVRARCWQKITGEEHLVCLNYVDIWLDQDASTVLGWEWVPVLSQHWWVDDPQGTPQTKERYTYDALIATSGATVDSRSSLSHAYYCRWASLYAADDAQHATPHWNEVLQAKPRLRVVYSLESRKKMARVGGYMPPLNWTDSGYAVTSGRTYTPLGINGHRAQINNVGAYDGRGQITRMDTNAIVIQSAEAWRVMRVASQAGLSMFNATYDHRIIDTQPFMRLIPLKFSVLGSQAYTGMGVEANHSRGSSFDTGMKDILEDVPVGGTGSFAGYDNDHAVPYSSFAAFITGEKYLHDASLSTAQYSMNYSNMNIYGHNKSFEWVLSQAGNAYGIPLTPRHGTIPSTGGIRGRAWSMNTISWAWANCSDNDPHKTYLQKALQNYDDFLADSYSYMHADHKQWGGWVWNEPSYYSPWMHAWVAMIFSQWRKTVSDLGFGSGFDIISQMCAKVMARGIDNNRLAALAAYVYRAPVGAGVGSGSTGWLATDGLYVLHAATFASSRFTITPDGFPINSGDKILLAPYNSSNGTSGLSWPAELNFTTIYYAVDVVGDAFGVSATQGGSAIAFTGTGNSNLGIDKASYDADVSSTPLGGDSQAMMILASLVASYMAGNTSVTSDHVSQYRNYLSTSSRAAYGPWNYSEEQS